MAAAVSCGAFVPLAVTGKWPLHTRRFSRLKVKALVTSNIIKFVYLVGNGRLKEMCGLEPRTNFFSFKKSARTSADYIRVRIRFENIRYINYIYLLTPWSKVLLEKLTSKLCR